ncbi:MAG: H-NS histone family protein [Marinobacterium sp.]|nr:H-NS histone family protein [Marinobacterium sp.]
MSEFIKTLTRKNSLRKHCQELAVSELKKTLDDLREIIEEKQALEEVERKAQAERLDKIKSIRKTMEAAGLDVSDLMGSVDVGSRKKVAPKYRLKDENGKTHEWSGRGRTPLVFQKFFEAGNSREDCLIND